MGARGMSASRLVVAGAFLLLMAIEGPLAVGGCESTEQTAEPVVIQVTGPNDTLHWTITESLSTTDSKAVADFLTRHHVWMLFPSRLPVADAGLLSAGLSYTQLIPDGGVVLLLAIDTQNDERLVTLSYVNGGSTGTEGWKEVQVRGLPGRAEVGEGPAASYLRWEEDGRMLEAEFGDRLTLDQVIAWLDSWYVLPGEPPVSTSGTDSLDAALPADEDLHPVGVDGKMGYIDGSGTMVIEPQFQRAETFSEGLAQAGVGDSPFSCRWGYIDQTGAWVIQPRFGEGLGSFSEGLALIDARNPDGTSRYGYIDKTGAWAVEPQFADARPFSEGLACVAVDDARGMRRYGFIDKTGAWAIEPHYIQALSFREGLAAVQVLDDPDPPPWGYIDKTEAWVIEPRFTQAYAFSEGLAFVTTWSIADGYTSGCVDKAGAWVFQLDSPEELMVIGEDLRFSEGLAVCGINTKKTYTLMKYGYLDKTGTWAIEPQFDFAKDFSEGRAVVFMDVVNDAANPGRDGYIDKAGKMVVEPQYFWADPFSGGLALVAPWYDEIQDWGMWYPPEKCQYIDETGAVIWRGR
jgi:hypothetical protein